MLDFYPMDGDNQVGFVEVPRAFEQWLIAVSGVSFEDVSLNILGEDEDGDVELIMDYDDYMNLCDLYYEYDTLGWMVLEDPDYVEKINAIPDYEAEGELDDKTIEQFISYGYILSPNGDPTNPEHWSMPTAVRQPVVSTTSWKPEKGSYGDRFIPKTFEAPYAGLGSLFKFGDNESALGGFTAKELTESSAIHGDFDSASLNYSGKQNLEVRQSETFEASADDYGDVEYIILELLTDAQLEEEYGEVMDDYGIGRDDLPQQLEDDYRTADEAEYLREKYLKEAETFDAHARHNIHRFSTKPKNNPRNIISGTRKRLKQQLWKDTTASMGVKGIAAIIAASAIGIYYWKQK